MDSTVHSRPAIVRRPPLPRCCSEPLCTASGSTPKHVNLGSANLKSPHQKHALLSALHLKPRKLCSDSPVPSLIRPGHRTVTHQDSQPDVGPRLLLLCTSLAKNATAKVPLSSDARVLASRLMNRPQRGLPSNSRARRSLHLDEFASPPIRSSPLTRWVFKLINNYISYLWIFSAKC